MANRKLVSEVGNVGTFQIEVKDRDEVRKATFQACKNAGSFKAFVAVLSDKASEGETSPLEDVYERYIYGMDLRARANAREAVAIESTIVKRDGKEIDIFKLPVARAVAAVNAQYAEVANLGGKPGTAFIATRKKLLEAGMATEKDGALVVK